MDKMRTVNKKEIEKVLFEGGFVRWYDYPWSRAELLDNKREVVGTIRFDTYLKLDLREKNMKEPAFIDGQVNDEAAPFWKLNKHDAWQGYTDFQLRPAVMNHPEIKGYYLKRIWR